MSAKKVRIGGWVDKKLKAAFLKQCGTGSKWNHSRSKVLASLLADGVAQRKQGRRNP